ncbi:ensconsin isoform X3 [Xenopus tropicalis]|uniref:Ensconsin isoform X3 n=1 Tax=Xenopus tropicalis TaxID=8364 RepID=A0A8J0QLY7_XENTR|nr:ensconsin isoform X3 [Xenopus tropicalis]|eukprot:XP_002936312.2 PREDICTED: ensconsin isoform X2 [Xenopus tropicalis]
MFLGFPGTYLSSSASTRETREGVVLFQLEDVSSVMAEKNEVLDKQRENKILILEGPAVSSGHVNSQSKVHEKKVVLNCPLSAMQGQPGKDHATFKSEPHLIMKVDDRQRLARERREEREKLIAARESLWLEKEIRARQHYEKHLEERKKKLEEQRMKEERRRAAVDEKRKLKLEEEKERYEAVVRRTAERNQRLKEKSNRWSWGGTLQSSIDANSSDPDRRSVSTMNLSKHFDPVINKRLSTSSATILNSPDKACQPSLSQRGSNFVSRLLMPTHSYLARSKSTAALSGDTVIPICPRSASCSPLSLQPNKSANLKSSERPKLSITTPEATTRRKATHFAGTNSVEKKEKEIEIYRENAATFNLKTANTALVSKKKFTSQFPVGTPHKSSASSFSVFKPANSIKLGTTHPRPLSPGNVRPLKKEEKKKDECKEHNESSAEQFKAKEPDTAEQENNTEREAGPETLQALQSSPIAVRPFAGTTNPEEATRILAEKRRLARVQREREEEERKEKEEIERKKREEFALSKAKERAQQEADSLKWEAERKRKEEEELQEREKLLCQLAEEKEQKEREELEHHRKQKEEAERIRMEREKHFQKEEQERSERKKRLEEIMRRTRRSEGGDKQSNAERNVEMPKPSDNTAIKPVPLQEHECERLQNSTNNSPNGQPLVCSERIIPFPADSTEKQPNENGLNTQNNNFEEIINLPASIKPVKCDSISSEENNIQQIPLKPILAFEEDGTLVSAEVI